ncbi:NUDT14 (predicted) [Pycnogonum litorale]
MDKITNIQASKCKVSQYIQPVQLDYDQDGRHKVWHLMKVHDSVSVILFNVSRQVLLFVRQFRPAIYYNNAVKMGDDIPESIDTNKYPGSTGITLELCAGIVDKNLTLAEITKEEIQEECGYDVPVSSLQKITSYRSGVGILGSTQTLFYAEIVDEMKVADGGGNDYEGEFIEVVELTIPEVKKLIYDETLPRPAPLLFALSWFLNEKLPEKTLT